MIFAELNMKDRQHLLVNAGFIDRFIENNLSNYFYGQSSHTTEIRNLIIDSSNLGFVQIPVLRSGNIFIVFFKIIIELFLVIAIFLISLKKKQSIFFLSSYPPVKIVIEIFSRIHPYRVYLVHHGELDGLLQTNTKRYAKFVRYYFSIRKSIKLIDVFLSCGIQKNAFIAIGKEVPSYISILHPFPGSRTFPKKAKKTSGIITIGYFGALAVENRERLQNIIDALGSRAAILGSQDFNLLIVAPNVNLYLNKRLTKSIFIDSKIGLSSTDFASKISSIDIALFPYKDHQYELIASGIAADCVMHQIHFLTTYSTFFSDFISSHKHSGTLFLTFDELLETIADPSVNLWSLINHV